MVIRIYSPGDLEEQFRDMNRNYFSPEAYRFLFDYYNEIDEDYELDVIEICGEWSEYGPIVDGDYDAFIQDYGYIYNIEDWVRDTYEEYGDADDDEIMMAIENGDIDTDDYVDELADAAEEDVEYMFRLDNGDFLISSY